MKRSIIFRILHAVNWRARHAIDHVILPNLALAWVLLRFGLRLPTRAHGLPGELIVSLTSYRPRFPTLAPTLKCLLSQNVRADRVVLWVSPDDEIHLPESVRCLTVRGLEIHTHKDIGPYTKIIPALKSFSNAFIVTADDDLYYGRVWLQSLVQNWRGDYHQIVCHRAHGIKLGPSGDPVPYRDWEFDVRGPTESTMIFPTGVGGVLYPPGALAPEVMDEEKFLKLSPRADDVWLYFMGRRASAMYKKTPMKMRLVFWPGSQRVTRLQENLNENGNDQKIKNMIAVYGRPWA
jgi:hypothetical protein